MVRSGGKVNFFGGCPKQTVVCLDTGRLHYSSITLRATFHHTPDHIREALELVSRGEVHAGDFIAGEVPLTELATAFRQWASRRGQLKIAILPEHEQS